MTVDVDEKRRVQMDDFLEAGLIYENEDGNFVVTTLGEEFARFMFQLADQIDPKKFN